MGYCIRFAEPKFNSKDATFSSTSQKTRNILSATRIIIEFVSFIPPEIGELEIFDLIIILGRAHWPGKDCVYRVICEAGLKFRGRNMIQKILAGIFQ